MRYYENFCVGCPQGCINCGRKEDVLIIECDNCGTAIWEEDDLTEVDGKDYCKFCYEEMLEEEEE